MVKEQPGFVSTAIYIDRDKNQAQTVSYLESQEAADATSMGSAYLGKVSGMLRNCIVTRTVGQWEVAHLETK